jgi:hypothetical protein
MYNEIFYLEFNVRITFFIDTLQILNVCSDYYLFNNRRVA